MESIKALTSRSQSGDKAAKDFLTKVKSKLVASPIKQSNPIVKI